MFRCQVCRSITQRVCAGCKKKFYCSQSHQNQDWTNHQSICNIPPTTATAQPTKEKDIKEQPLQSQKKQSQEIVQKMFLDVKEQDEVKKKIRSKRLKFITIQRRNLKIAAIDKYIQKNLVDLNSNLQKLISISKQYVSYEPSEANQTQLIMALLFHAKILFPKRKEYCRESLRLVLQLLPQPLQAPEFQFPKCSKEVLMQSGAPHYLLTKNDIYSVLQKRIVLYHLTIKICIRTENSDLMKITASKFLQIAIVNFYTRDSMQYANYLYFLSTCLYQISDFLRAKELMIQAMARRQHLCGGIQTDGIFDCIMSLAYIHKESKELDRANNYLIQAERLARKIFKDSPVQLGNVMIQRAKLLILLNRQKEAFNCSIMALQQFKKCNNDRREQAAVLCTFIYRVVDEQLIKLRKQEQDYIAKSISPPQQLVQLLISNTRLIDQIYAENNNYSELKYFMNQQLKEEDPLKAALRKDRKKVVSEFQMDTINISEDLIRILPSKKIKLLGEFMMKIRLFSSKVSIKEAIVQSKFYKQLNINQRQIFQATNPQHFPF